MPEPQTSRNICCIFCGRCEPEVSFNREHIIPQNVGGTLFLDDAVCVDCNSDHGAKLDHEILKLPEVLYAFDSLNLPHDRDGMLKEHYTITGKSDTFELKFGTSSPQGFSFRPQRLADGSLIVTEDHDVFSILRRQVQRDPRARDAGLSQSEIEQRIDKLHRLYEETAPGNDIDYPPLGLILRKGTTDFAIDVSPREKADVHPLIAKIAYEMLFFLWGPAFLGNEWADLRASLLAALQGKEQRDVFIMRQTPRRDQYRPFHFVRLEFDDRVTLIRVVFFDYIEYLLVARPIPSEALIDLAQRLEADDWSTLVYQQNLLPTGKSFWRVNDKGEATCILAV